MRWLNYHHLMYFWLAAREGGIVKAGERLRLAPSTISGQIRMLEASVGHQLFDRSGRELTLTDVGQRVFRYAEEIFGLGQELLDVLDGQTVDRPLRLEVGIADVLPKLVTRKLLEPGLTIDENVQLVCREGKPHALLAELAVHGLDVVLTDAPVGPNVKVKAYSHLLGEGGVEVFGTAALVRKFEAGFPQSLERAPFILPTINTVLRRSIDEWFQDHGIRPQVVAEFEDSALLKVFGQTGAGLFISSSVVSAEIRRQYRVKSLGPLEGVRERFYAITVDRKLVHPAVVAISNAARHELFAS